MKDIYIAGNEFRPHDEPKSFRIPLAPSGRTSIQVITVSEDRLLRFQRTGDDVIITEFESTREHPALRDSTPQTIQHNKPWSYIYNAKPNWPNVTIQYGT